LRSRTTGVGLHVHQLMRVHLDVAYFEGWRISGSAATLYEHL
jgi:hypothetical protein